MFNEDSAVVKTWVRAIERGDKHEDDVPDLFNLRDVVLIIINGEDE